MPKKRDGFNEQVLTENNAKVSIYAGYNVHYWTIIPSIHTELSYNNDPYRILKVGSRPSTLFFLSVWNIPITSSTRQVYWGWRRKYRLG